MEAVDMQASNLINNQNPRENQREETMVSTELEIGFSIHIAKSDLNFKSCHVISRITKKRKRAEREESFRGFLSSKKSNHKLIKEDVERERIIDRIRSFRFYSLKDERDEKDSGVYTKLKLFEDPWTIKKILKRSDVDLHLCRLLLPSKTVEKHITAVWDAEMAEQGGGAGGVRVVVWDYDTGSAQDLVFKRWHSSKSFVFTENWVNCFVTRRELKEGDQIGLFWDRSNSRFGFRVLARNGVKFLC